MSAADAKPLQYMRWSSSVEVPFWQALADQKLESMKLSEEPVPLGVTYEPARAVDNSATASMRFVVAPSALGAVVAQGPAGSAVAAPGQLFVFNRVETFKELNKSQLLAETAQGVWDDILSGAAAADPSLLNRFALITFADLKTWTFYYWFCFPGLSLPSADGAQPTLLEPGKSASEALGDAPVALMQAAIAAYRADASAQSVFVVTLPGAPSPAAAPTDADSESCAVCSLASWQPAALVEAMAGGQTYVCVVDPCPLQDSPGWVLRNVLCMLAASFQLPTARVLCFKQDPRTGSIGHSLVLHVALPAVAVAAEGEVAPACPKAVGWEMDDKGKPRPRKVDMGPVMDPRRMAESAVDLNLKLMRWRLMPALQVERVAQTKCLLLGAGTLGCQVARSLLGWGVRNISLVDSGRVSFSNPVRQSLFDFEDCTKGGKPKAAAAATHLEAIFPGVTATGYDLSIPMPGHPMPASAQEQIAADVKKLEGLVLSHDVIFLLTDTRESRWLPSLLAAEHGKLALTVALGFDSFLVMRHGVSPARYDAGPWAPDAPTAAAPATQPAAEAGAGAGAEAEPEVEAEASSDDTVHLGCYFCNDVVAPTNSMSNRTLDQQCTVTRPGLAPMSGAMAVEMLVNLAHHPAMGLATPSTGDDDADAAASAAGPAAGAGVSPLGSVPHQVRGFLSNWSNMLLSAQPFNACTACSDVVRKEYRERGVEFVKEALQQPEYLEELTGLAQLKRDANDADMDMDWLSEDDEM
jgi:ubiquitin-like modifier-activating enzyme ATG7